MVNGHGHAAGAKLAHRGMRGAEAADGGVPQRLDGLRHAARERLQAHRARRRERQRRHGGIHRRRVVSFDVRKQALGAQVVQHARKGGGSLGRAGHGGVGRLRRGALLGARRRAAARPYGDLRARGSGGRNVGRGLEGLGDLLEVGGQFGALLGQLFGALGFQVERQQTVAVVARGTQHLAAGHVLERGRHAAVHAHGARVHRTRHVGALQRGAERAQQEHGLVGRALRLFERQRSQTRRIERGLAHHLVDQFGKRALDLVGAPGGRRVNALVFQQLEAFLDGFPATAHGNVSHLAHPLRSGCGGCGGREPLSRHGLGMFHVKHLFFCRTTLSRLFHVKHRRGIG